MKKKEKQPFPGYPSYPESEDIYKRETETDLDPEQLNKLKTPAEKTGKLNEKDFKDDVTGSDLDVPGAELDDTVLRSELPAKGIAGAPLRAELPG